MIVTLDFESASDADLSVVGAYAYWEHPTTEILCLCWHAPIRGEGRWIPSVNDGVLTTLRDLAADPNVIFEAHNAAFEQAGWELVMVRQYGMPPLPPERWDDTMARCFYRGLPGALDKAGGVLGLVERKDTEGRALTLSLSKPMTMVAWEAKRPEDVTKAAWKRQFVKGTYDRSLPTLQRVAEYCAQDVRTEIELSKAVGPLSAYERRVWVLDQKMNQRGLRLDLDYIAASRAVVAEATKPLLAEFEKLTGIDRPTKAKQLLEWCNKQGLAIDSLAKENLAALGIKGLDDDEGDDDDNEVVRDASKPMPEHVHRALSIRAVLGSASITKLARMQQCVCYDGRVRYAIQYHGAGTGRWAGRLFQPQNFPRGKIDGGHDPDALVAGIMYARSDPRAAVEYLDLVFGDPIAAVASGLRHAMVAGPGNAYCTGDFAGIEARVVLALAGQHDKCEMMSAGQDVYLDMACDIYRVPSGSITKKDTEKRQIGKNTVLGCGFGMGWQKFRDRYCANQPEDFARNVIDTYRRIWAPEVPKLWAALEEAALKAVYDKGKAEAYGITYEYCGDWLACHIPDGQTMWYRQPEICSRPMPWDPTDIRLGWSYWAMKMGQWRRIHAYGGLLTENVVQKIARGLLCDAMHRLEANGLPLVLTVHDECMSEVPMALADKRAYEQIMAEPTDYARAIKVPIAVEGWVGERYRK